MSFLRTVTTFMNNAEVDDKAIESQLGHDDARCTRHHCEIKKGLLTAENAEIWITKKRRPPCGIGVFSLVEHRRLEVPRK